MADKNYFTRNPPVIKHLPKKTHLVPSFTYTEMSCQFTLTKLQKRMPQEAHYYSSVRYDKYTGHVLKIQLKIKHYLVSEKHHQSHFIFLLYQTVASGFT